MDEQTSFPVENSDIPVAVPPEVDVKPKGNKLWWLVGIGCAVLCVCLFVPILVISALTLMGPTVGSVFSDINQQLEPTVVFAPVNPGAGAGGSVYYADPLGNGLGDPNAPVTIVIYSDFQCPYCKEFAEGTEQQIIDSYVNAGKVYLVYRSMGNFLGDYGDTTESQDSAMAAYCAGEQDKFWEYHDLLFANWDGENQGTFSKDNLISLAGKLELDQSAFADCLTTERYLDRVNQDRLDAEDAGVGGTPSFVINGDLAIEGNYPFEDFQTKIEDILQNQ